MRYTSSCRLYFFILAALLLLPVLPAAAGINQWTSTGPYGGTVNSLAIDPDTPSTVYAAASLGGLYKSVDGGGAWRRLFPGSSPDNIQAVAIDPNDPSTVYAGGSTVIHKSTDAGESWNPLYSGYVGRQTVTIAIDPGNSSIIYAGTSGGGVIKTSNAGGFWYQVNSGLTSNFIASLVIDPHAPSTLYACTLEGTLFISTDGALSWRQLANGLAGSSIASLAVDPASAGLLYAGATNGRVFKSTDGGDSWSQLNASLAGAVSVLAIDPAEPDTLYAGTVLGIFKSSDAGGGWTPYSSGLQAPGINAIALAPAASGTIYVGSDLAGVFKTSNAGASWSQANNGLAATEVNAVASTPLQPDLVYAGTAGGIFKSSDGGGTWRLVSALPNVYALAIDPVSPATLYAGCAATSVSGVYKSVDGGENWSRADTGITESRNVQALAVDPLAPATLYAATEHGVFKSSNGGGSWSKASTGITNGNVTALAIDPTAPAIVYAGTAGGVFRSANGGAAWNAINSGLPATTRVNALAIDPAVPSTIYAATSSAGMFKSYTSGGYWGAINDGLQVIMPGQHGIIADIRSLAIDRATLPATIYAGTGSWGAYKSTNGGAGWGPLWAGVERAEVRAVAVDHRRPASVHAGVGGGAVQAWSSAPVATISPAQLDFGPINAGMASSPLSVTIGNAGSIPLVVSYFAKNGLDAGAFTVNYGNGSGGSCGPTPTILPNGSCSLTVTFTPASAGAQSAHLAVNASGQLAPLASLDLQGRGGGNLSNAFPAGGSYAAPLNVTITAIRPATIYYTTDGSDPLTSPGRIGYSRPIALSATTPLKFYGVDQSGYAEPAQTVVYAFSGSIPGGTPDLAPPDSLASPAAGAYRSSQNVTLACSDEGSGCANTLYCFGAGCTPGTPYQQPFSVTVPTTVRFSSTDYAGNREPVQSAVYSFDNTPPTTTPSPRGGVRAPTDVYLSCSDGSGSGCQAVYSCLGEGCTPALSTPFVPISSSSVLRFYSVDYAGNSEEMKSASYSIDADAPTASPSPAGGIYSTPQRLTFSCNDGSGSGCYGVSYCLGSTCNPFTPYTVPIDIPSSTHVRFRATDRVGNEGETMTVRYTVLTTTPATIRVPSEQPAIQAAIDAANDGDTVLVSPGTYVENVDFKGKAITVASSGGAEATVIDGNDAGPVVSLVSGEWNSSRLSGFTLRKGKNSYGGGITIENSSPTITGNRISGNTACRGAGIYLYNASPVVQKNVISGNHTSGCTGGGGGGISAWWAYFAEIIDNEISDNNAGPDDGGGIEVTAGGPVIRGNVIKNNKSSSEGGGIYLFGDALVTQNLIANNFAHYNGGGIAVATSVNARLVNNSIIENSASRGSGVYAESTYGDKTRLVNNIIVAKGEQSALYCDSTSQPAPTGFQNNLVHAPSGQAYAGICRDLHGKDGNITSDPKLYSSSPGYYYLTADSPVIDAGSDAAAALPPSDLYGHVRLLDGDGDGTARIDIGAAEYDATRPLAMMSGAPGAISNTRTVTLAIGGERVAAYRYSLDGAPFSAPAIPAATPLALTGLPDGQHTLRMVGISPAQKEQLIPYATTLAWLVDATAPATAATPPGGSYSAAQSVTLSCDDGSGTGCAATWYCLGSGCTPSTPYGGAISIAETTELRFYSTDLAGNSEAVVTASYLAAPQIELPMSTIDFGHTAVEMAAVRFFAIRNSGLAPLVLSSPISVTGTDSASFKVSTGGYLPCASLAPTIAPGETCTVAVTFLPSPGAKNAKLNIVSDSLLNPEIYVPLKGTGVPGVHLTTNISGSGSINTFYWPPFNCADASCTVPYPVGATLQLWATPSALYRFQGWSGGGCSGTGSCTVRLDADTVLSASFTPIPLVQASDTLATHLSLQEAYAAVGDGHKLRVRNETVPGDFSLNRNIKVTVEGGMNSDFATAYGHTVVKGTLRVRSGRVNVKNVRLR